LRRNEEFSIGEMALIGIDGTMAGLRKPLERIPQQEATRGRSFEHDASSLRRRPASIESNVTRPPDEEAMISRYHLDACRYGGLEQRRPAAQGSDIDQSAYGQGAPSLRPDRHHHRKTPGGSADIA
jgi:hypothetical protein